jgi:hypothetical protein
MDGLINLNKNFITKEDIILKIGEINVFKHYSQQTVEIGNVIKSPLRNEHNPSFGYFIRNNEILFNDFVLGGGDCIRFVMLMFNLTRFEALSKIAIDFKIDEDYIVKYNIKTKSNIINNNFNFQDKDSLLEHHNKLLIKIKSRNWKLEDFFWWKQFGINVETLKYYNVKPLDYIFLNDNAFKADKYAYSFEECKDETNTYKIYQPYNKNYKWINNHNYSVWQGWNQLPNTNQTLIITKSLKDVMSIYSVLKLPSVSLQAETAKPKDIVIEELKERFNNIYVLYDNDFDSEVNWGRKFGKDLCDKYGFLQLEIPDKFKSKDFSDLVFKYGDKEALKIWEHYIFVPF